MSTASQELVEVLQEAKRLLAIPGNDFSWSSFGDYEAAEMELDGLIATLESGMLPPQLDVAVLFAVTGPIQEVSLSSGWADEFLSLAERYDAVEQRLYAKK